MMKDSPLLKRAQRRDRNKASLDLNLVSLIDIFTILIFFLLANASDVEVLPNTKAVSLPESTASKSPRETVVVVVSEQEITVQGVKVASVPEVLDAGDDVIAPLRDELVHISSRKLIRDTGGKQGANPEGQAVTIMGDKAIPYRLLRKVMVTCAQADFNEVSFAVLRRKG